MSKTAFDVMNVAEIGRYYSRHRALSRKKELPHSKSLYVRLLDVLLFSHKINQGLVDLIENELLHELPTEVRKKAVAKLNELDGFSVKNDGEA